MRRRNNTQESVGEDSFLDTTANLVGILIILVVVIGTKTKLEADEYSKTIAKEEESQKTQQSKQVVAAQRQAMIKQDIEIKRYRVESEYRKAERDALLAKLALAKAELAEEMSKVDVQRRESVQRDTKIQQLQSQLEALADQAMSDEEQPRPTVVLEHLPTPMAKTVFNREMHIQLRDQRITTVPWDRLVEMLKKQVPLAARRKSSSSRIEDTLGPVSGFVMHYALAPVPGGLQLDQFHLEVLPSAPSETLQEAFESTGRLALELASRDPKNTVITVWTYPGSFETFRELKARLFSAGFLSAARPLPEGQPIAASPRGTRSSAQ